MGKQEEHLGTKGFQDHRKPLVSRMKGPAPNKPNANRFFQMETEKFLNKEVEVTDSLGNKFEGICRGINASHLNAILMTGTEKILVRNLMVMRRKRRYDAHDKK